VSIANVSGDGGAEVEKWVAQEPDVPIRDVSKEPVRMGVFICHCGVNIGGYVDVPEVVAYARTLPFVAYAADNLYTCSVDAQKSIIEMIGEHHLNRVVVASCTPRTHEPLFQDVLRKSGLNPYLFNMANIRDQCSWVHMDDKAAATQKAKDLVRMAAGKAVFARQLERKKIGVTKSALVIGAGMAGMSAALALSGMGFKVTVCEKSDRVGGNALRLSTTLSGRPVQGFIAATAQRVRNDPLIELFTGSTIARVEGYVGNFKTTLHTPAGPREIEHGAAVIAVGALEEAPKEYGYGSLEGVVTHSELDGAFAGADDALLTRAKSARSIVMIQCAACRRPERPYCSRVCCNQAVRNAIAVLEANPDCGVTVLYRDMRTYGMAERLYRRARQLGVTFIRYDEDDKPKVTSNGGRLRVSVNSPMLAQTLRIDADTVSLASAIVPDAQGNRELAQLFKVPINQDGFFMEAHAKLRPVDFATEGVYVCGLAHNPRDLKESIAQGKAAAARAATVISKETLETEGTIASVDISQCTGCGSCEKVCAYGAITVGDVSLRGAALRRAQVNEVLCKGCGTCAANCRCGAVDVSGFTDRQIVGELESLLRA
ncbi:MAG: NAD(P)-binding protein, partial [Clostridia bacterium]|nr:NAD(P)-binding protein [Clostridia bacterium]